MFPDSKNPFAAAAAPTNGSAPSPFQPAATNGSVVRSPFESAALAQGSQTSLPQPKRAPESPASPFALVEETAPAAASPFEPALVEPTEGFAVGEAVPPRLVDPAPAPAPVAMPHARAYYGVNGNHNDPFAAPSPSSQGQAPARRADFVLPAEGVQPAPMQQASMQQAPMQQASMQPSAGHPTPSVVAAVTGETSQLVLRAIFGVTRELDRGEILQRARTLPGVRNLHIVGQSEGAAMASLRVIIQRMGFGDQASLALTTSGGVVDIIEEPGTTLAVLHEGTYAPGVHETLIIVARELSRLG
jgi:hypothetical protein